MKKIFILLFTIILISLSLFVSTNATETVYEITTEKELASFFENGGKGVLKNNIVLNDQYHIYTDISLDFNGYTLSADDTSRFSCFVFHSETDVVLLDSTGKGGIYDNEDYISITVEDEVNFTVESGRYDDITANGGTINLVGGEVIQFGFDEVWPLKINWQNTKVGTWHIGCCKSVNKLPNQMLTVGFQSVKNDDGTYNVQNYTVEKVGKTLTLYYDAYVEEIGKYQLTEDGTAPKKLMLEILHVNNGNSEFVPMECVDKYGRLWKCKYDKAYIMAKAQVTTSDKTTSTYIFNLPDRSGMTYNVDKGIYGPRADYIWFVVGGVALLAVIVIVVILLPKKKKV